MSEQTDKPGHNCATCARAGKKLTADGGKCQKCCDASKPGDHFPGYQAPEVKTP